ncbi:MAG: PaaI family thioesterase [Geminicoccaceae bacterium]
MADNWHKRLTEESRRADPAGAATPRWITWMPPFEARDPDFAAVVAASFARQGLMRALGIALIEVTPGACVLCAAVDPRLTQQQGYFHGALIGAMLDCAGGYAAHSLMPPGSEVLTTEYKVNFIAAAEGDRLIARGRVIKPGRTLTIAMAEAFTERDGTETACAIMLSSLIRVPAPR